MRYWSKRKVLAAGNSRFIFLGTDLGKQSNVHQSTETQPYVFSFIFSCLFYATFALKKPKRFLLMSINTIYDKLSQWYD